MNVSPISMYNTNKNNNTYFGAKINVNTAEMDNVIQYLKNNSCDNSEKYLGLLNKIISAFEKHPSNETLTFDIAHFKKVLFGARGTVKTTQAAFIDTEPAREDSIAPILNIFRRILNPENKESFNKLMGKQHSSAYNNWWKKNIAPIWKDINKNFREETFFKGKYDKQFNSDFNRESGNEKDFFNQFGNFWIKLYNASKEI